MPTFTPPTFLEAPPVLPEGDPEQSVTAFRLFRFYRSRPAGRNIYIYRVGTASEATNGRVTETDPQTIYSDGVAVSNGWEDIEMVCWGGHGPVEVTQDQADALTAEGFTVTP